MVVSEERLLSVGKELGVSTIKVKIHRFDDFIVIDTDSVESFFENVALLKENVVFYVYTFNEKEDYIIPLDFFDYNEKEILDKVYEHNNLVEGIDFDLPKSLYIYVLKDGLPIMTKFINDPIEDLGLKPADKTIEIIEQEFYREDIENADSKLEELRKYILENASDIDMKNVDLRYDYLASIVAVGGQFEGYDRYFERYFGHSRRGSAKNFMDKLKVEYDHIKKNNG